MDIRALDRCAIELTGVVVDDLDDNQLDLPTPCDQWTVRDVIEHLVDNAHSLVAQIGGHEKAARGDDDIRKAYWTSTDAVTDAFWDDRALEAPYRIGEFGEFTGAVALAVHFSDVLLHGWDLAQAVGVTVDFDENLVAAAQGIIDQFPEVAWGPDAAYAARLDVPENASALERLLATTGRTVNWVAPAR